jgi:hypothetical protein
MPAPGTARSASGRSLLPAVLAALVLAASFAAIVVDGDGLPAWALHAVLALAVFPLILAAMTYFTPVLTRRPGAPRAVRALPLAALAAGAFALLGLRHGTAWLFAGAVLAFATAATFLAWMAREAGRTLGGVHPGLRWYQAALACLLLGLAAILAGLAWPEHWPAARRLHLHLNLLGFIGLTAIGTLQVLLPTAAGYGDPQAGARLRLDLKYALSGTLAVAIGAALWTPAAWVGVLLWLAALARFAISAAGHRRAIMRWHLAAAPLAAALAGWVLVLADGALHASALSAPRAGFALFLAAFLLPLVSGAATHLLPLWLKPRADSAAHARLRSRLARASGIRALVFLASGLLVLLGIGWAIYLAAAALAFFLIQLGAFLLRLND